MKNNNENLNSDDIGFDSFLKGVETSEAEERAVADFLKILKSKADKTSKELGLNDSSDMRENFLTFIIEMRATLLELQLNDKRITLDQAASEKRQLIANYTVIEGLESDDPLFELIDKLVPGGKIDVDSDDMQPHYVVSMEELTNRDERQKQSAFLMDRAYLAAGLNPEDTEVETSKTRLTITQMIALSQITDSNINVRTNREQRLLDIARKYDLDDPVTQKIIQFIDTEFPL